MQLTLAGLALAALGDAHRHFLVLYKFCSPPVREVAPGICADAHLPP
jgi:hypothetical protein